MKPIHVIVASTLILMGTTAPAFAEEEGKGIGGFFKKSISVFKRDDKDKDVNEETAKENADGTVPVEKVGDVVIPLNKPKSAAPDSVATGTVSTDNTSNDLAEAYYSVDGTRTPYRKPPPPPPSVQEIAAEYGRFSKDLLDISAMKLDTPKEVRKAYSLLKNHEPGLLSRGWVAKAAVRASQDVAFQNAIRNKVADEGLEKFLKKLDSKKYSISKDLKAGRTSTSVVDTVMEDVALMHKLGDNVLARAYSLQKSRWGALELPDTLTYEDPVLSLNFVPAQQLASTVAPLQKPAAGAKTAKPSAGMKKITNRVLKLAARMELNASGGRERSKTEALMANQKMEQCLSWARLNMNQCVAVAGKPSEWAFCTSKHALKERANCWSWVVSYGSSI